MLFGRSEWWGEMMESQRTRGFLWGMGAALATYFLWPSLRGSLRPAAKGVVRGALAAGDRLRYALESAQESLEDLIAEAQFERSKDHLEADDDGHGGASTTGAQAAQEVGEAVGEAIGESLSGGDNKTGGAAGGGSASASPSHA